MLEDIERAALLAEYRATVEAVEAKIIEADDELYVIHLWCKWRQQFSPGDDDNER